MLLQRDDNVFDRPFCRGESGAVAASIFESADPAGVDVSDFAGQQFRAMAMALGLQWVNDGDFTFDALDAMLVGMVDLDGDDDINDEEEQDYNDLLAAVAEALVTLGGKSENVMDFIDNEDDDAGKRLGERLASRLEKTELSDDDLIVKYTTSRDTIMEATVKVVRNGKVVLKKKKFRKHRMNAAQRAALKKARRKANTAAARRHRAKSMKIRRQRGI